MTGIDMPDGRSPARLAGDGVGLVLVSHSAALAEGLRDLVAQMAPGVVIAVAGGTPEGELGTSPDLVMEAVEAAERGAGAVLLCDLGSARMSAELATETLDAQRAQRVHLVEAPFVEGALAAGVAAAGGQSLAEVVSAARGAGPRPSGDAGSGADAQAAAERMTVQREVLLSDPAGLHARPAARVVRALRGLSVEASVAAPSGASAPAASLTGLLGLSAVAGSRLTVSASGPDADTAVQRIVEVLTEPAALADEAPLSADGDGAVPAAPGRAVGPLSRPVVVAGAVPDELPGEPALERERLERALCQVRNEMADSGIGAAHRALLEDPALLEDAYRSIADGVAAPCAWWHSVSRRRDELAAVTDPLIASRAVDVTDVGERVLGALTGEPVRVQAPRGSVVLVDDLPPSQVTALVEQGVVGFVLRSGGARSHSAVLARASGIPMVVAAGEVLDAVAEGAAVVVDGTTGEARETTERPGAAAPAVVASTPTGPLRRADGSRLLVTANVGSALDARAAADNGAEGVGLLRTELLFTGRSRLPDEEDQVSWLTEILRCCPPGPVVVRTVDLGGDKPVPGLGLDPVRHGFLGVRGLRLCLARPELFSTHLRAVLRASAARPVELMFPFVTEPGEVRAARAALREAVDGLRAEGAEFAVPAAVGMMVEIPTTVVQVGPFLPLVDFLSVGSNDLAQYLSASDRTLGAVGRSYRAGERVIPELVAGLSATAAQSGVGVAVCGDLAGDPVYAQELVAAGVSELSVAPPLVARLRAELARSSAVGASS